METPLDLAIQKAGLQALAAACGVRYQFIQKMRRTWRDSGAPPTAMLSHAPAIEAACDGSVRADDLYPLVDWDRDRKGRVVGYRVRLEQPRAAAGMH